MRERDNVRSAHVDSGAVAKGWSCLRLPGFKRTKAPAYLRRPSRRDFAVPVDARLFNIGADAPRAPHEKSTTCVEIVLVRLQVSRQILDPFREDRDLDFRGARIGGVNVPSPDQCRLFSFVSTLYSVFLCLICTCQPITYACQPQFLAEAYTHLSLTPRLRQTTFQSARRTPDVRHIESDSIRRGISPHPSYTRLESGRVFARVEADVRQR